MRLSLTVVVVALSATVSNAQTFVDGTNCLSGVRISLRISASAT